MHRVLRAAGAVAIAAALLGACSSDKSSDKSGSPGPPTAGNTVTLQAKDFSYSPTLVQAKKGQASFVVDNGGAVEHNLTVSGLEINKDVEPGTSAVVTVTAKPGTYAFHCEYHPTKMKGTITISG